MKLKILALDASSTCTGFSKFLYDETTKNYEFLGTSNIKATDKDIYKRFHTIHTSFVTQGLYEWPDQVVFENYAFNGNRVTQLAELNGLLKYNFTLNNTPISLLSPKTIKLKVSGSGNNSKDAVRKSLKNHDIFKETTFKNNDESDSAAIGFTYILKCLEEK